MVALERHLGCLVQNNVGKHSTLRGVQFATDRGKLASGAVHERFGGAFWLSRTRVLGAKVSSRLPELLVFLWKKQ